MRSRLWDRKSLPRCPRANSSGLVYRKPATRRPGAIPSREPFGATAVICFAPRDAGRMDRELMNPSDDRAAQKYRTLVAAMEDPNVGQNLGPAVQRAMVDHQFGLAHFGPDEPAEVGRFVRLADTLFRGQAVQADL